MIHSSLSLDRTNININDVLGNYSLTLIDSLDMLAIMGNRTAFHHAVAMVVEHVDFDQDSTVQVRACTGVSATVISWFKTGV